jgi:hypothetical protein
VGGRLSDRHITGDDLVRTRSTPLAFEVVSSVEVIAQSRIEALDASLAARLGPVQGVVGLRLEVSVFARRSTDGDAHARSHPHQLPLADDRLTEVVDELLAERTRERCQPNGRGVGHDDHDHELVATDPGNGCFVADAAPQSARDL